MAPAPHRTSPRKLGRRIALIVYYAIVTAVALTCAVELTLQVFAAPAAAQPFASCHDGLRALFTAVTRARKAAAGDSDVVSNAEIPPGEDAALARFREALEPAWSSRDTIASMCHGSTKDEGALDAIERLRYAEEHAVRREAGELAPLRRRVQAIVDSELSPVPVPGPHAGPASGPPSGHP